MRRPYFQFKQFNIYHDECAMKVGTDGVLVGAWADVEGANTVLDIGTGTGLIAVMAAQKNPTAQIIGIDVDEAAFRQAQKNVSLCQWNNRITVQHSSLQDFINTSNSSFQAIISNPPFFNAGTQAPQKQRHYARHTQTLSHEELLEGVQKLLENDGKFSVILPYQEGIEFEEIASQFQLYLTRKTEVFSKKGKPMERLLLEFQKNIKPLKTTQLIIQYEARNDWTPDYVKLTKDFYYKM